MSDQRILFKAAAETLITIAADPNQGARVGITSVLQSWGCVSLT
jgi:hypothetical protein